MFKTSQSKNQEKKVELIHSKANTASKLQRSFSKNCNNCTKKSHMSTFHQTI